MSAAALYGLVAWGILTGACATLLPWDRRLAVAVGAAGLALTPLFAGESLAMALHGALASPSGSLLLLGIWRIAAPGQAHLPRGWPAAWLVVGTLIFYGLALGLGPVDPYGLGYRPGLLIAALVPLAAGLAWRGKTAWLLILALDLAAYGAGLFANLWDALFDPLLVLLVLGSLLSRRWRG